MIQKRHRGAAVRKRLAQVQAEAEKLDEDIKVAAMRIQAAVRGFATRREVDAVKSKKSKEKEKALKIKATQRGQSAAVGDSHIARAEAQAATAIQAAFRSRAT